MNPNKIIRSKRKTLSLTINENAELIIRAPKSLSIKKIQDFINEKENWINRKKRLIENQIKDVTSNHNKLLYLGNFFPINVEQNASKELFFTGEEFIANSIEPGYAWYAWYALYAWYAGYAWYAWDAMCAWYAWHAWYA